MSVRSQYPAAQSRPQRPDWRVSLTTQERPRRPSSPGSRAEPSRAFPDGPGRSLRASRGTPGRGLQGAAPRGDGALGSRHLGVQSLAGCQSQLGMRCVPVPPTLRHSFSGPRPGGVGFACHEGPYAQVYTHTRARGLGGFLLVLPASHLSPPLHSTRSGPRDGKSPPAGPAHPTPP